jgi:hypothetical protein
MQAHFLPAALTAAGALTGTTPAQQRAALVDTCSANSDLALIMLRALGSASAASLISQCDDNLRADLGVEGACTEFAPRQAGGAAAAPQAAAGKAEASRCPFRAGDIASDELLFVKQACANQSTRDFCLSCHCGMQSTVAAIAGRHKQQLDSSSKGATTNSSSSVVSAVALDCSVEMMQAMMAGGVFSRDALAALTGDTCRCVSAVGMSAGLAGSNKGCGREAHILGQHGVRPVADTHSPRRWFVKLSPAEQADTCHGKDTPGAQPAAAAAAAAKSSTASSSSRWPTATALLLVLACLLA